MNIECSYDPDANAAYVYLTERSPTRRVSRTRFCDIALEGAAINVDSMRTAKSSALSCSVLEVCCLVACLSSRSCETIA